MSGLISGEHPASEPNKKWPVLHFKPEPTPLPHSKGPLYPLSAYPNTNFPESLPYSTNWHAWELDAGKNLWTHSEHP